MPVVLLACALCLALPAAAQTGEKGAAAQPSPAAAGGAPASPATGGIPFKREAGGTESGTYVAVTTLGVLALGVGVLLMLRRRVSVPGLPGTGGKLLRVTEAVSLGGTTRLVVVEFDGRPLLLAQNREGVGLLWPAGEKNKTREVADAGQS